MIIIIIIIICQTFLLLISISSDAVKLNFEISYSEL